MKRRGAVAAITAATGCLAIDGNKIRPFGPHLPDPGRETGREQSGVDPIHQQSLPATTGNAVMERQQFPQKRQMRFSLRRDVLVVVTIGDRTAHRQKQYFR